MVRFRFRVSPERYEIVLEEISEGSEPGVRFYAMVAISTMIAGFGLITNSTAVIIGAMLVAPLMTPIFGLSLALIRGDTPLFAKALRAEIIGVAAAILMGFALGSIYPALEPTPEMLSRTEPQLFDLLVAVFSGLAGAYALLDEKLSPALPGVAIATAIVPPLANAGLCFSVGEHVAGIGSFLLFFANFLSILLVASVVFWLFGMAGRFSRLDRKSLLKRFSLPVVCFVLVAAFLTQTLVNIVRDRYYNETIETTLESELLNYADTTLDGMKYDEENGTIYVLVDLHSSRVITPTQVGRLQNSLQQKIELPVKLAVRSKPARGVTAPGSEVQIGEQQLDGSFIAKSVHPRVRDAKIADTLIRNYLAGVVGFELDHVRITEAGDTRTVVATIYGVTTPHPQDIRELEARLQKALKHPDIHLLVNFLETRLYDESGPVHVEFAGVVPQEEDETAAVDRITAAIENEFATYDGTSITQIEYNVVDGVMHALVDTYGSRTLTPEEVATIERDVSRKAESSLRLFVSAPVATVTSSQGYESYTGFARRISERQLPETKRAVQSIIESSNM